MSWWKTFFGGSAAKSPSPQPQPQPQPQIDLSDLAPNEDPLYLEAARLVTSTGRCSVSAVQRHLKIGYNRAARLIEALEDDYIISGPDAHGSRHLLTAGQRNAARSSPSKAELEHQRKQEEIALRTAYLVEKYGEESIALAIVKGKIWEGMTAAQLFDSAGEPDAVDQKYMKNKSREVWKYDHEGSNRYLLRVTLENGLVVGWNSRS
ncbi:DNA translocase FtsK [Pseudomonas sp. 2835]|uniref:DNA translocase FtsK n=1 Tax=Pseudomonas sp. 2835 TaxID=3156451 RepID=UPI003D1B4E06